MADKMLEQGFIGPPGCKLYVRIHGIDRFIHGAHSHIRPVAKVKIDSQPVLHQYIQHSINTVEIVPPDRPAVRNLQLAAEHGPDTGIGNVKLAGHIQQVELHIGAGQIRQGADVHDPVPFQGAAARLLRSYRYPEIPL